MPGGPGQTLHERRRPWALGGRLDSAVARRVRGKDGGEPVALRGEAPDWHHGRWQVEGDGGGFEKKMRGEELGDAERGEDRSLRTRPCWTCLRKWRFECVAIEMLIKALASFEAKR